MTIEEELTEMYRKHDLYMEQWKPQNRAARKFPLRSGMRLVGTPRSNDDSNAPGTPVVQHSDSRNISSLPQQRRKMEFETKGPLVTLTLGRSLHANGAATASSGTSSSDLDRTSIATSSPTSEALSDIASISSSSDFDTDSGSGLWAQAWLAYWSPAVGPEISPVVLKLFQESLFPAPDAMDYLAYDSWCARTQCKNEAWAFDQLRCLQGTLLPHSYGFYEFKLPCGETVTGHVMEYVDGKPLQRDYDAMIDGSFYTSVARDHRRRMLGNLAEGVHHIHTLGVHHGDLSESNVLQLGQDPLSPVFIDFSLSSPMSCPSEYGHMDAVALWHCWQVIEEGPVVYAWLEECIARGEPWTAEFGRLPPSAARASSIGGKRISSGGGSPATVSC